MSEQPIVQIFTLERRFELGLNSYVGLLLSETDTTFHVLTNEGSVLDYPKFAWKTRVLE